MRIKPTPPPRVAITEADLAKILRRVQIRRRRRLAASLTAAAVGVAMLSVGAAAGLFSHSPAQGSQNALAARGRPLPPPTPTAILRLPPDTPCLNPDAADLRGLAQAADVAVEADVLTGQTSSSPDTNGVIWTFPLTNVQVLRARDGIGTPSTVSEIGTANHPLLPPGHYILLLTQGGPSFYVTSGMAGAFRIVDGLAQRHCPNYADPASPIPAEGSPPGASDMRSALSSPLPARPSDSQPSGQPSAQTTSR